MAIESTEVPDNDVHRVIADRLTGPSAQDVVLVVGSGLTTPIGGIPGVPDTDTIVDLLGETVKQTSKAAHVPPDFEAAVAASAHRYQAAFEFAADPHRGNVLQASLGEVVRRAVLDAFIGPVSERAALAAGEVRPCQDAEENAALWSIRPGIQALGRILANAPENKFGAVLTSNFDPLIEMAVRRAHGDAVTIIADLDSPIGRVISRACYVVHFHGYWYGSMFRNRSSELQERRRMLTGSLREILLDKIVCVVGYGGWDDVVMDALADVIATAPQRIEILWCFYGTELPTVRERLRLSGTNPAFQAFEHCDADLLFPQILERVKTIRRHNRVLLEDGLEAYGQRVRTLLEENRRLKTQADVLSAKFEAAVDLQASLARGFGKAFAQPDEPAE